jgi:MFS transporter, MHS family, alpha-ketoglutarate permease
VTRAAPTTFPALDRSARRAILAGSIGNAVEFVDWNIYATFSPFFAAQFFPSESRTAALLSALAVFAVGFLMRPIGGAVLGSYCDRHGRMAGLTLTVVLMAAASLVIAICPGYASVGIAAPVTLVVARLVQGFSNGGEFAASSAFLVECAPPGRRAFFGSWQQVTVSASHIVVAGLATVLAFLLPARALHVWGWRVAFAFGGLLGLAGLWIRLSVAESELFLAGIGVSARTARRHSISDGLRPLGELLTHYWRAGARVVGITVAGTMTYYIWITYMAVYAHVATGIPLAYSLLANTIAIAAFTCAIPFGGMLSDRLGRRPTLLAFSGGFALFAWPAFHLLRNNFWNVLAIELVGAALLVGYSANCAAIMAEQFPTRVRAVGIAFPYALAVAVFGGTAPYITTWLAVHGAVDWTAFYVIAASLASFAVYATMPETSRQALA